jgi:hypothetical protein
MFVYIKEKQNERIFKMKKAINKLEAICNKRIFKHGVFEMNFERICYLTCIIYSFLYFWSRPSYNYLWFWSLLGWCVVLFQVIIRDTEGRNKY